MRRNDATNQVDRVVHMDQSAHVDRLVRVRRNLDFDGGWICKINGSTRSFQ